MDWAELNQHREALGYTIREFSEILQVSEAGYKRWKTSPGGVPGLAGVAVQAIIDKRSRVAFQIEDHKKVIIRDGTKVNATIAAESLDKGCATYGFTLGQFSISDLICELLKITGPSDVIISTWAASAAKIEDAFALFESGDILSCRFLLDAGIKSRQAKFLSTLVARFGNESIRTVSNHAKFVVIRNEWWDVVIKTSMNLNHNPRLENYEICEGAPLANYITEFVDYIFRISTPNDNFKLVDAGGLHKKTGCLSEADLMAALDAG